MKTAAEEILVAITEIINEKKRQRIHPPIATIREVVDRTEMQLPDVNCDIDKLIEAGRVRSISTINSWGFELITN